MKHDIGFNSQKYVAIPFWKITNKHKEYKTIINNIGLM